MRTFQLFLLVAAIGTELFFTSEFYAPSNNPTARLIVTCTTPRTSTGQGRTAPPECVHPELAKND